MGVGEGVVAVIEELPDGSRSSILDGGAGTELWGKEGPTGGVHNGDFVGVLGRCCGELAGNAAMGIFMCASHLGFHCIISCHPSPYCHVCVRGLGIWTGKPEESD